MEKLRAVYEAASGLCCGTDWNNGTHAQEYRGKLLAAVRAIKALPGDEFVIPRSPEAERGEDGQYTVREIGGRTEVVPPPYTPEKGEGR